MSKYSVKIEIPKGRVQEILDELHEAKSKIRKCYMELEELEVVTITETSEVLKD